MTQTITRMYPSQDDATAVVATLRRHRLWDGHVYLIGAAEGQSEDEITAAIMRAYVSRDNARLYAPRIRAGGTLIVVHAPFGSSGTAIHIMEQRETVPSGTPPESFTPTGWDGATPLSSAFGLKVLLNCPAPMSQVWNVSPLTAGRASISGSLGLPELTRHDAAASRALGIPLLGGRAAPLSALLRLPTLKNPSFVTEPF